MRRKKRNGEFRIKVGIKSESEGKWRQKSERIEMKVKNGVKQREKIKSKVE